MRDKNQMENTNKRYCYYIDVMRVFFSICVIAIHAKPLLGNANSELMAVYNFVVSMAVPFFFVTSGFFLGDMMLYEDWGKIHAIRKKYVRLYLIWNIIYLPLTIWGFFYEQFGLVSSLLHWVRGFVVLGEQFCSWQLWYLLSMIIGTFIIQIVGKRISGAMRYMLFVIALFSIAAILSHPYLISPSFTKIISVSIVNGRLLTGSAYLFLGIIISQIHIQTKFIILLSGGGVLRYC